MNKQDLFALIDKYLAGEATGEEIDMLSRYYNSFQQNGEWKETELGSKPDMEDKIFSRIREEIKGKRKKQIPDAPGNDEAGQEGKVIPLKHKPKPFSWVRIAAAASVIGLLILGAYVWLGKSGKKEIAGTEVKKPYKNDVLPGGDKAVLTLADGSTIVLDDAQNGALTRQGNTKVIKLGGKLAYDPAGAGSTEVVYNTIATPRGGQYQVELADGSQVWLNAASSLRFPTAFAGKERRVEITGEAYFEVAKNKNMPFIVRVNGAEVQVLGTHFNVMAYGEEEAVKTTLLEGSVKFVSGGNASLLKPGQQSQLTRSGQVKVVTGLNTDDVIAWKNGMFLFENSDLETVMRQLARWYDVEVVYQGKSTNELFVGAMPRSSRLSDVLKVLELTGNIHFEIEGKKIIVKP